MPVAARSNAIGIARRAPHPNAALLFLDYMITDAQELLASLDYVPTKTGAASPLKNLHIKLVDPVVMLDQREKWSRLFADVFIKRTGM